MTKLSDYEIVLSRLDQCKVCGMRKIYFFDRWGRYIPPRYDDSQARDFPRKGEGRHDKGQDRANYIDAVLNGKRRSRALGLMACWGTQHEWKHGTMVKGITLEWERRREQRKTSKPRRRLRAVS